MRWVNYFLEGLGSQAHEGHGRWGFVATLDRHAAVGMRVSELDKVAYRDLNEQGREIIAGHRLGGSEAVMPYHVMNGSWFLHGIRVPGSSCGLELQPGNLQTFPYSQIEAEVKAMESTKPGEANRVVYIPCRIERPEQARCLSDLLAHFAVSANMALAG
jgi:hypothetical protein